MRQFLRLLLQLACLTRPPLCAQMLLRPERFEEVLREAEKAFNVKAEDIEEVFFIKSALEALTGHLDEYRFRIMLEEDEPFEVRKALMNKLKLDKAGKPTASLSKAEVEDFKKKYNEAWVRVCAALRTCATPDASPCRIRRPRAYKNRVRLWASDDFPASACALMRSRRATANSSPWAPTGTPARSSSSGLARTAGARRFLQSTTAFAPR